MQLCKESGKNYIVYGETLNISDIHSQRNVYQDTLNLGQPFFLRASAVHSVDTASLQLLLSFVLMAKQREIPWNWEECPPALYNAAQLLGMESLLGMAKFSHKSKEVGSGVIDEKNTRGR